MARRALHPCRALSNSIKGTSSPFSNYIRSHSSSTTKYFLDEANYETLRRGDPPNGDKNSTYKGWSLLIKRSRDVIDALCEKDFNKLLHIYCTPELVQEMGEVSHFSCGGCTDNEEDYQATKDLRQYRDGVSLVDFSKSLPFGQRQFQFVVSLPHPTRHLAHSRLSTSDFSKLINFDGIGMYGASSSVWRDEGLMDQFVALQNSKIITFKSLFMTELDDEKCFYYVLVVKGGAKN